MNKLAVFVIFIFFTFHGFSQQVPVAVETVIQLETVVKDNPPSISFYWNEIPGDLGVYIYKKGINLATWELIGIVPPNTNEYTDYNVQSAVKYEYRLVSSKPAYVQPVTYVNAGIQCKETEYRGKIILLVDTVFSEPLQYELSRLETDLIGDGWEIIRRDISRYSSVQQVKNLIHEIYFSDFTSVNTVFLVGHIPVPYSGELAFDGHNRNANKIHEGAWPADLYYGDMNESFWTDSKVNNTLSINPENHNVPGDGKFDQSVLENQNVLLAVGRVDFFDLPEFSQSEIELMRNYLDKDHKFRHKMINPKLQALVDDNLDPQPVTSQLDGKIITYEMMALSGWRNFTALLNFENVKAGKVFGDGLNDSYIWTYGCGFGTFTSCSGLGTTSDFVSNAPKTVFTGFYGSFFGDWNTQNNFLRSALASDGWILTSCWSGRPLYVFHHMGMGETIGSAIQRTQNNYSTYYNGIPVFSGAISISLMGDPTLRMHVVSSVKSLIIGVSEENTIELNWQSPDEEILGYYVYKLNLNTNKFERMNTQIVNDTYYTDNAPEPGNNYYMVRALQLTKSASGSYYNLSQGIFDTIQVGTVNISDFELKDEIEFTVYPNPATNKITIETGIKGSYNVNITTLNGRILFNKDMENTDYQIDLSTYPNGIYFITIRSKYGVATKKIVKM